MREMETVPLEGHQHLLVDQRTHRPSRTQSKHWWLLDGDTPIAFLHTLRHLNRTEHAFILCDIEVRPGHRGHGLTRSIIEAAQNHEDDTLHTSGSFTPLGAQALGWIPLTPGTQPGVRFNDMAFVEDWDTLHPRNPL